MRFLTPSRLLSMCLALGVLLFCTPRALRIVAVSRAQERPRPDVPASGTLKAPPAPGRGIVIVRARTGQQVGLYTASYALVIGVSAYTDWPTLPEVQQDIREITTVLQEQGFQVEVVRDPKREALQRAFDSFIARYGQQKDHRLLIYFAGHGHTMRPEYGGEMGYIVPADAPNPYRDAAGFRTQALDMYQIETYARRIQAKHVLFLFDSCFSGSFFSLSRAVPDHIQYKTSAPVRQFITSGSADEQVPDKSIFRQQVVAALRGEGDTDGDGYVTGTELGEFLQKQVVNYSRGKQHPQYGKLRDPYLDKGDFVFTVGSKLGGLSILGRVSGTEVVVNDTRVGETKAGSTLTWGNLTPGSYRVQARKPGYAPWERETVVVANQRTEVVIDLKPLPTPQAPQAPAPAALQQTLSARLAAALPSLPASFHEERARRYDDAKQHKAQAVSLQPASTWRTSEWESAAVAEEKVLEGCQVRYGQPCALVAVNEAMQPSRPGGDWPRRTMARVTYEGPFRPEVIPVVPKSVTQRTDIAGYGLAVSPKALALHPWGRVFAVTGASTQRAAEEQALATCNADPNRKGQDGPCYLYAVGNHVILSQRHTEPRKPATTIADALAAIGRKSRAAPYASDKPHKALAVQVDTGRPFWKHSAPTADTAEQSVLESCQLAYGAPCVLVAVDDALRAPDLYSAAPRDMPRLKYEGPYRPAMVPLRYTPEQDKTISAYPQLAQPKAMAIRPSGTRISTAVGKTVAEAEGKALAACNEPESAYPCFLYAVNDRVVLPQRRTEPGR